VQYCPDGTPVEGVDPPPLPPDARDLSNYLVEASISHATDAEISEISFYNLLGDRSDIPGLSQYLKLMAYIKFYTLVKDGARFDVKDKMLALGLNPVKLGDNWYEYSTPGNFLYGFYGVAAGFTGETLHQGAGIAQILDYNRDPTNGIGPAGEPYYGDTVGDYWAIEAGIYAYGLYISNGDFNPALLQQVLDMYGPYMDVRSAPPSFIPLHRGPYSSDEFDQ
jgi:hypothetical protein